MKNRLKDLREDHDLTQQMVADQIGITQRKYSYIEQAFNSSQQNCWFLLLCCTT